MQGKSGFNVAGKLTSIEETDGNTINCTYSGGKLTEISGDAGSFTLSYSGDHVTKVTDSTGRSIDLTYDGDNLISVRNPDADSLRFSYDANGYLASVENFEGQVYVENTYDESGHVIHQYAANIGTFDFSYDFDARHNICTGTDGYLCEIWYDELGRITASKDASGTQHVGNELNQAGRAVLTKSKIPRNSSTMLPVTSPRLHTRTAVTMSGSNTTATVR